MKTFTPGILLLLCLTFNLLYAQDQLQLTEKDSVVSSSWMIGLGINVVDDSGDAFDELFAVKTQWNALPYPSRISIGRYFKSGFGIEAMANYNKYKIGKTIDGVTNLEETDYYAIDTRLSFDLNKLIGETAWFDPYVGLGVGYTQANDEPRGTYNAVIGFRTWFTDRWGFDFSSSGKWAMTNSQATNHLQHAAGIIYRFDIEKDLSKKGIEKLAMIEALARERQQQQDSIDAAERARAKAALAEKLAKERQAAELAAANKARIDVENERRQNIREKIDALGHVYFELNSSYLDKKSKIILDSLRIIMRDYPKLELKLIAHTDSRGTSAYNDWLSKRRADRTMAYLVDHGVAKERLTAEAHGEKDLLNECDDHTYCNEEKHQINRRSEFLIMEY